MLSYIAELTQNKRLTMKWIMLSIYPQGIQPCTQQQMQTIKRTHANHSRTYTQTAHMHRDWKQTHMYKDRRKRIKN